MADDRARGMSHLSVRTARSRGRFAPTTLDVVFTSNFLEHLPDKASVERTVAEAQRCLKNGGLLICLGRISKSCLAHIGISGIIIYR